MVAVVAVGLSVVAVVVLRAPTTTRLRRLPNAALSMIVEGVVLTMAKDRPELLLLLVLVPVLVEAVAATRIGTRADAVKTTGTSDHPLSVFAMNRR